jgi:HK97 family phage prohead protease
MSEALANDLLKSLSFTKAATQSDSDPFEFVLSDETIDRAGDIVRAKGWHLEDFEKNPVALYGHDHKDVIGRWENVRVTGKQLIGNLVLAATERGNEIKALIEQGILKAVSVGFQVLEYEPINKDQPWKGLDIKKAALHEVSVVAVPANPNALMLAKAQLAPETSTFESLFKAESTDSLNAEIDTLIKSGVSVCVETVESDEPEEVRESNTPRMDALRERIKNLGIDTE